MRAVLDRNPAARQLGANGVRLRKIPSSPGRAAVRQPALYIHAKLGVIGHPFGDDIQHAVHHGKRLPGPVERRDITSERDPWVKRHAGGFATVLVAATCSGAGTWRRNPDANWRLKPSDLEELADLQRRILESAARLAKPGGRLIYATCSLFQEENADQVAAFLKATPDFSLVPAPKAWKEAQETLGTNTPCPSDGDMLVLTPAQHGTDGFFVAVMEKKA